MEGGDLLVLLRAGLFLDQQLLNGVLEVLDLSLELRAFVHEDGACNDRA